jgi:AbrB family looped-hinge helix DNA binding protein
MENGIKTTMDAAGRLVVPKRIREQAGLKPGLPLTVSFRGGRVEIEPAQRDVRVIAKGTLRVALPDEPSAPLTNAQVERTLRQLREERR